MVILVLVGTFRHLVDEGYLFGVRENLIKPLALGSYAALSAVVLWGLFGKRLHERARARELLFVMLFCGGSILISPLLIEGLDSEPVVLIENVKWVPETEEIEVRVLGTPGICRAHAGGTARILVGIRGRVEARSSWVSIRNDYVVGHPAVFERTHVDVPAILDPSRLREMGSVRIPLQLAWPRGGSPRVPQAAPSRPTLKVETAYVAVVDTEGYLISPVYKVPFRGNPGIEFSHQLLGDVTELPRSRIRRR
jgi:hypothetical protein